jgi:tetratricopeptide (TPR) repeat protein
LPLPETKGALSFKQLQRFASIQLFGERASQARPDFALNEGNADSVMQICRRLDGIPLAIELAAARIKVLSVDEIATRLDDRFSLLTSGSRTAIPRHQTLRATIDWSYDLLTEPEQILLRRLSVFAGGFALEAAEAVCSQGMKRSDTLDVLGRLVDKSLVIVEADPEISETRYRLLETIRQYALEKLVETGEASAVRDQHLEFFIKLAEEAEPKTFGGEAGVWFRRLGKELDNIRAAMEWSTNTGKAIAALRMAGSLVYFSFSQGPLLSEWHDRSRQALSRPEGLERTLARAKALNGIGFLFWADMYPTDWRPELEEALSIGRELGDRWNVATALRNLGLLESIEGNYAEARSLFEQSLEIWRELGYEGKTGRSWSLIYLGDIALIQEELERARSLYEESISFLRALGDMNFLAYSVRRLGQLAWREGDYEKAVALFRESLIKNQAVGDQRGAIACLAAFAAVDLSQGKYERATQILAAVETQLSSIGIRLLPVDKLEYERSLAALRGRLDERTLARYWADGSAMSLDEALAFALDEK